MKKLMLFGCVFWIFNSCSLLGENKTDPESGLAYRYQNKTSFEKIKFETQEFELENGLKVVVVPRRDLPIVSYFTLYKVGSRHEPVGLTGASHFLEHLMFKGSKNYPNGKYDEILESVGGSNNAYATYDATVYHAAFPAEQLEVMISLEADRMNGLNFDEASFEKEKKVILEERKMRLENSPEGKIYDQMLSESFKKSFYEHNVLGNIEDIEKVTREQIFAFYKNFYVPNNATIFIVGDVSFSHVKSLIKSYYDDLPRKSLIKEEKIFQANSLSYQSLDIRGISPDPMIMLSFPGAKDGTREALILDLMTILIGDGKSSFFQELYVETDNPKLSELYAGNIKLKDSGVLFINAQMLPKIGIVWLEKNMRKQLRNICNETINERNLQKAKNHYLINLMKTLSTNDGIADYLVSKEMATDDYTQYKYELQTIANITVQEAQEICSNYINPEKAFFISLWNRNPIRRVR